MTSAVCFKCGNEKFGPLSACGQCGAFPQTEGERSLSLVLCKHLSSKQKLAHFSDEIRNGFRLAVPEIELAKAREALKNPQLMAMLATEMQSVKGQKPGSPAPPSPPANNHPLSSRHKKTASIDRRQRKFKKTALHKSPFWLLGATTRDDRRRITELAEEKSLELDPDACQKARSNLTNPRTRLGVEMAWLPGVSPKKATQLAIQVLLDPMSVRTESGLPSLAHANLMAAAFEVVDPKDDPEGMSRFILEMASLVEGLSVDDVIQQINEDRSVSGFPEVYAKDQVEGELAERKRYFTNAIKDALNRVPTLTLVEAMTLAVDKATASGEDHAPELLDELVDSYELESQGFLQKEAENIQKLIKAARDSSSSGEETVRLVINKLELVARNWNRVAKPIQLSAKARGIEHGLSNEMAYSMRNLAIDLYNEQDMLVQSNRIIGLLQELFSELPELAERVEQDADALQEIFQSRKQAGARWDEWAREISYSAKIGMVFKNTLSISPEGVAWNNKQYPLDAVTRVRWGGVKHYLNGIPMGTTYTVAFGDKGSEAVVELRQEEVYSTFIDKLWRAVCVRLITEFLELLKAGGEIRFGEAVLRDENVTLIQHKFLGSNEAIRCPWHQIHIWSANGQFYIGRKDDKKTYVGLPYISAPNTHVLEQLIRMAFKKPGIRRLSDVLQDG
jgi:hypothetical protein